MKETIPFIPNKYPKTFDDFLENAMFELEEYGDYHRTWCQCNNENDPDACDCDMYGLKPLFKKYMKLVSRE